MINQQGAWFIDHGTRFASQNDNGLSFVVTVSGAKLQFLQEASFLSQKTRECLSILCPVLCKTACCLTTIMQNYVDTAL